MCASRASSSFKISTRNQNDVVEEASTISELFLKFKTDHFRRRYGVRAEAYDFGAVIQLWRAPKRALVFFVKNENKTYTF